MIFACFLSPQFVGVGKRSTQHKKWAEGSRGGEFVSRSSSAAGSFLACNYVFMRRRDGQQGDRLNVALLRRHAQFRNIVTFTWRRITYTAVN